MDKKNGKPPKEKKRNSERRKERSRDAARCRRSRETEIFTDLAHALPLLPTTNASHLDKASIMRLAIAYLRVRSIIKHIPEEVSKEEGDPESLYLKALDGFLLVVSSEGDIVFLSENVTNYLGLTQMELMGQSIYEVSHPCDHSEIKEILATKKESASLQHSFLLRLKCTLTSKGRNVNLKSASYKVIQCTGHVLGGDDCGIKKETGEGVGGLCSQQCLVAIGEPIPHPVNIETPLGHHTFLSQHSLDMKFSYADDKMEEFLGYESKDLMGKSIFDYFHAQDSPAVEKAFKSLFSKGQSQTGRYRFLARGGGYAWIMTQATLIHEKTHNKPQSVVCVNYVISGIENRNEIYSCTQQQQQQQQKQQQQLVKVELKPTAESRCGPVSVTEAVFRKAATIKTAPAPAPKPATILPQVIPITPDSIRKKVIPIQVIKTLEAHHKRKLADQLPQPSKIARSGQQDEVDTLIDSLSRAKPFPGPQPATLKVIAPAPSGPQPATLKVIAPAPQPATLKVISPAPLGPQSATLKVISPAPTGPQPATLKVIAPAPTGLQQQDSSSGPQLSTLKVIAPAPTGPQTATTKTFVPKTKEMNKGYLYIEDESGITTKDELDTEDLTHLAPTAGDVCIPLIPSSSIFADVLDTFMLNENYGPLLSDTSKEISPASSPYFHYRDDLSNSGSQSPALTHSPGGCSLPSLCSMEDSPALESTLLGLDIVDNSSVDADDFAVTAPYIPMSEGDDLPLLTGDFMWGSGLNSPTSSSSSSSRNGWSSTSTSPREDRKPDRDSSLAKLLLTNSNPAARSSHMSVTCRKGGGGGIGGGGGDGCGDKRGGKRAGCPELSHNGGSAKRSRQQPSIARPGVLDGGGRTNSVLMNLLDSGRRRANADGDGRTRLKSLTLLDPDGTVPSLMDLTEQDYAVNAPSSLLLHGSDLLTALDVPM
ncbi:hypoxia-inducible factor 1-alpha [Nilaparvata lugens]|uniref:hypoxia-inducible factor 1-alpha n=1 Tax=Nilaparvata lugens TaxID=108931 RepID=UPI00193DCE45|nr:hypoxia-inducible factor 1-alpha [Nilaparvata lugens]